MINPRNTAINYTLILCISLSTLNIAQAKESKENTGLKYGIGAATLVVGTCLTMIRFRKSDICTSALNRSFNKRFLKRSPSRFIKSLGDRPLPKSLLNEVLQSGDHKLMGEVLDEIAIIVRKNDNIRQRKTADFYLNYFNNLDSDYKIRLKQANLDSKVNELLGKTQKQASKSTDRSNKSGSKTINLEKKPAATATTTTQPNGYYDNSLDYDLALLYYLEKLDEVNSPRNLDELTDLKVHHKKTILTTL